MKFKAAFLALLLSAGSAFAQPSGQLPAGFMWGNPTAAPRTATPSSMASLLDQNLCSTTGAFAVRTAGGWVCGIFGTNLTLTGNTLTASGGAGGSPGGATTQVQFNNASVFGGSANLTWISPTLQVGSTAGATGILALAGITSGVVSIKPQDIAGTFNFNLPTTAGAAGQCLNSGGGGSAPMTWVTCAAPVGANTQVQFNSSGVFGASANLTWATPKLTIGLAGTATGQLGMAGATSGNATIQAQAAAGTPTLTLPNTTGTFAVNATGLIALDPATGQLSTQMATGFLVGRTTAGAGVMEQITVGTNLTLAGGTLSASGGAAIPSFPQGRLTLTTATPITTTDVSGATAHFYTPAPGHYAPISTDGVSFTMTVFNELTQTTSDTTKSPYAMPANANVDICVWSDSGTLRATRTDYWSKPGTATMTIASPAVVSYTAHGASIGQPVRFTTTGALPTGVTAGTVYYIIAAGFTANQFEIATTVGGAAINTTGTQSGVHTAFPANDTSRGTGAGTPEVDFTTAIPTNKSAITNGAGANKCTLVGSVRSNASNQLMDTVLFRWVSNAYNSVPRSMSAIETANTWVYTTAAFRQMNGNPADQVDMLQTLAGGMLTVAAAGAASNSTAVINAFIGIGIDQVTANNATVAAFTTLAVNASAFPMNASYQGYPGLGRHFAAPLEWSAASGTTTWYGTGAGTILNVPGINGWINN